MTHETDDIFYPHIYIKLFVSFKLFYSFLFLFCCVVGIFFSVLNCFLNSLLYPDFFSICIIFYLMMVCMTFFTKEKKRFFFKRADCPMTVADFFNEQTILIRMMKVGLNLHSELESKYFCER